VVRAAGAVEIARSARYIVGRQQRTQMLRATEVTHEGSWSAHRVARVIVIGMTALSTALWAGGSGFGDDDHDHENEGPAYWFRQDTISHRRDAKVTVAIKDRGGVITRPTRSARIGFRAGKEISPNDVLIT
jgi:hypothetical protein